ncbi:oxidoreductase [Corallococcus carmarthensis]|uniref:SDR family NAD(P)-dependent oxidoreductase n=1 Tax=Corallococcus carmarthensis TaxID=2316728 RepID=A0A3A8KU24_9BACT|nr:oxidoreductase [Corallococcus carmarthensis]RKH07735.1 SDR family NAD(P)-dependent oxidoreductase [Corallococcus carmarthensis]
MATNDSKVWFITGISRGLGRELAKAVLARGGGVVGTTRDGKSDLAAPAGALHVLPLELTDAERIPQVVKQAHALHGRLDVVVNNAGYGLLGAIEEATAEEARHVFDVNFFGPLHVVQAALPFLRAQRRGHIVNITSIAGLAPMAGSGLYAAAKCALEGLSLSLAQEVAPLGLKVTLVEPGAFRTDFLSQHSRRETRGHIEDYATTAGAVVQYLGKISGKQLGDPALGAKAIVDAVMTEAPPLQLVLGTDALRRTRERMGILGSELDRWEAVTKSTDLTGPEAAGALRPA